MRTVGVMAELLRSEAPVLSPFMRIGSDDPIIFAQARPAYEDMHARFCSALLARSADMAHPDPERAVEWTYRVVYSVLARWLGLGSAPEAAGEGDWEQVVADLSAMVSAYLAGPPAADLAVRARAAARGPATREHDLRRPTRAGVVSTTLVEVGEAAARRWRPVPSTLLTTWARLPEGWQPGAKKSESEPCF